MVAAVKAEAEVQFTGDARIVGIENAAADPAMDLFSAVVAIVDGLEIADLTTSLTTADVPIDIEYANGDIKDMTKQKWSDTITATGTHDTALVNS